MAIADPGLDHDPARAAAVGSQGGVIVADLLYDGLTEIGADGRIRPALAIDWAGEDDYRTWRFELDPDRIDTEVVAAHLRAGAAGATAEETGPLDHVDAVTIVGAATVVVTLDRADPTFAHRLAGLAQSIVGPGAEPTGRYRPGPAAAGTQLLTPLDPDAPTVELHIAPTALDAYEILTLGLVDAAVAPPDRLDDALRRFGYQVPDGAPASSFVAAPQAQGIGVRSDGSLDLWAPE